MLTFYAGFKQKKSTKILSFQTTSFDKSVGSHSAERHYVEPSLCRQLCPKENSLRGVLRKKGIL